MIYCAATLPCRIKNFIVGLDVRSWYHLDIPQMAETRLLIDVAKHLYAGDDGFLIKLDQKTIVAGIKMLRDIYQQPGFCHLWDVEMVPGADVKTDDEILDAARQGGGTVYHAPVPAAWVLMMARLSPPI